MAPPSNRTWRPGARRTGGRHRPRVVERARAGDHRAFRSLIAHYDRGLRALAYRLLGNAGQMDDVLQDAYVKAFRALGRFRGDAGVGTWIYRITYNACI